MNSSDLDLEVLKVVFDSKKNALDFASECDEKIFAKDLWRFSKLTIDYIKVYKDSPTRRVLIDSFAKDNESLQKYINGVCDQIDAAHPNEKEFRHNLKCLKDRYSKQLIDSLKDSLLGQDGESSPEQNIQFIQSIVAKVKGLYKTKVFDQKTVRESVDEFVARYSAKMKDPNFGKGILTGYSFIDFQTNGLKPAELFLVAGESGAGKSVLLMNLAIQMWLQGNKVTDKEFKKGYNVLFFSLEMPHEQCLNRLVSKLGDISYRGIRDGNLLTEDMDKLKQTLKFMKRYPHEFEIIDIPRGATAEQLELIFNEAKNRFNPDIVVVDYLGLMSSDSKEDQDWLQLGEIAASLHEFARVYNVCVLSAVQLNRMAGGKGKESGDGIGLHRIGRSAMIAHNANVVMQIEKRVDESNYPDMILHFIKNRDGELIKGKLLKDFSRCALRNDFDGPTIVQDNDDISERLEKLNLNDETPADSENA